MGEPQVPKEEQEHIWSLRDNMTSKRLDN